MSENSVTKFCEIQDPSDKDIQPLINLYNEGQFQQAVDAISILLQKFPNSFTLLNIQGAANQEIGQLNAAVESFKKAVKIKPDYAVAYYNMGNVFQEQLKLDKAIEVYKAAVKIKPTYADAYYNMGTTLASQNNFEGAIAAFEKALSIKPDFAEAFLNLGNAFNAIGKQEEAIQSFDMALKIWPDYVDAWNNMGLALRDQGKLEEALKAYNKALKVRPGHADTWSNMGIALKDQGKLEEAIHCYNKALDICPDCHEANTNLAVLFYESSRFEEAAQLFAMDTSIINQTYLLKCFYEQDEQQKFYKQLEYLLGQGENNCVIGSFISRAEIRYGVKKQNPFCNEPLKYVLKKDLTGEYNFNNIFVNGALEILSDDRVKYKREDHFFAHHTTRFTNGVMTAGNIFTQVGRLTDEIERVICSEIEKYKILFKDSNEGIIKNWPKNYSIFGWLVSMKNGGELSAHIHETGWVSGSV